MAQNLDCQGDLPMQRHFTVIVHCLLRYGLIMWFALLGNVARSQGQLLDYTPFSGYAVAKGILGNGLE